MVAPSLPGFGFSEAPKTTGFGVRKIAALFDKLMRELGYPRYLAQGQQLETGSCCRLPDCPRAAIATACTCAPNRACRF